MPKTGKSFGLSDEALRALSSISADFDESQSLSAERALVGYRELRRRTLGELRGRFSHPEWLAMIDNQNGTLLTPQLQGQVQVFLGGLEDGEELDGVITRHGADAETLFGKIRALTAAQVFFLQEEIARFWATQDGQNRALEAFIGSF